MPETPRGRSEAADVPAMEQHLSLERAALFHVSQPIGHHHLQQQS